MPAFERPSAISASTSRSRGVSLSSGRPRVRRENSCATTSGSSAVPPSATRRTASRKSATSHDPVLEQVADPSGPVGQQLGARTSARRTGRRRGSPFRARAGGARSPRAGPRRGMSGGRRMSTIARSGPLGDAPRGPARRRRRRRRPPRCRCRAAAREAVAQQREVLGDHDPHGSSAWIVVGRPGGWRPSTSVERLHAAAQPAQPAAVGVGSAAAVVADLDAQQRRRRAIEISTALACACLPTFASASATTNRRRSRRRRRAARSRLDRDGPRTACELGERGMPPRARGR